MFNEKGLLNPEFWRNSVLLRAVAPEKAKLAPYVKSAAILLRMA